LLSICTDGRGTEKNLVNEAQGTNGKGC
jgi:hypothetical protein